MNSRNYMFSCILIVAVELRLSLCSQVLELFSCKAASRGKVYRNLATTSAYPNSRLVLMSISL